MRGKSVYMSRLEELEEQLKACILELRKDIDELARVVERIERQEDDEDDGYIILTKEDVERLKAGAKKND